MNCHKCGKQINDTATFCPFCGQNVELKQNIQMKPNLETSRKGFKLVPAIILAGISLLLLFVIPSVGVFTAVAGIICGAVGIKNPDGRKWSIIGMIVSIVLVLACFIVLVFSVIKNELQSQQSSVVEPQAGAEGMTTTSDESSSDEGISSQEKEGLVVKPRNGTGTTILIYMVGSDLESNGAKINYPENYGCATMDMDEIMGAKFGDDVRVIVETGGSEQWGMSHIDGSIVNPKYLERYQLISGKRELVDQLESASMANPDTLSDFLKWGVENYPAERFMVILWNHGGGTAGGYGLDYLYNQDNMDLLEIQTAFKNAGYKFDVIGFDACLMATLETAYALREYGDYLVASENTESGEGWYYTDWINAIGSNSQINMLDLSKEIVDSYINKMSENRRENQTLSVLNLNQAESAVSVVSNYLNEATEIMLLNDGYKTLSTARKDVRTYGLQPGNNGEVYDVCAQVDVIDFLKRAGLAEENEIYSVLDGQDKFIVYEKNTFEGSHGVAMYLPSEFQINPGIKKNLPEFYYTHTAEIMKKTGYQDPYFKFFDVFLGRIAELNGYEIEPQCNIETIEEEIEETVVANPYITPILTGDGYLPVQGSETGRYYIDMTNMPKEWRDNLTGISYITCKLLNDKWYITSYQTYDRLKARAEWGAWLAYSQILGDDFSEDFVNSFDGIHSEEEFLNQQVLDLRSDTISISPTSEEYTDLCGYPALMLDTGNRTDVFGYYYIPAAVNGVDSNIYVTLDARDDTDINMNRYNVIGYAPVNKDGFESELRNLMPLSYNDEICPEFLALDGTDRIKSADVFKFDSYKGVKTSHGDPFTYYKSLGMVVLQDAFGMEYCSDPVVIKEGQE